MFYNISHRSSRARTQARKSAPLDNSHRSRPGTAGSGRGSPDVSSQEQRATKKKEKGKSKKGVEKKGKKKKGKRK